ncbi:phage tail protein [Larkinella rosea]|uniref:Phage tail protein n=1 Tax=Larkinella rosea TaxID=2025312 RepID=A0A3P1C3Y9_9BACT|nr:phage tail protein [Larkinella rosea]RRB07756.1 phage tail protein [Larkinella rosea]
MATKYPLPKSHFRVDWGGTNIGFSEVTGLTVEHQVIEYREGSSPDFSMIKMPGLRKYNNITLKRGITQTDSDFFKWLNSSALNTIDRRDLTISLLNQAHEPVVVWKVKNAWPSKMDSGSLDAKSNDVAIESLELVNEGITVEFL